MNRSSAKAAHPHIFRERIAAAMVIGLGAVGFGVFLWIVGGLVFRGWSGLGLAFHIVAAETGPEGMAGLGPILVSTGAILGLALAIVVPIGLGAAIYLSDYAPITSRWTEGLRVTMDILAGVPSILWGLFGNALFSVKLGMGFSLLSGGLTLGCMILPTFIRIVEEGLRSLPTQLRMSAQALGISKFSTLRGILLPLVAKVVVAGIILSVGRVLAETAALIYTSGFVYRAPESLMDSGRTLAMHIYDQAYIQSGTGAAPYGAALVLLMVLLSISLVLNWFSSRWFGIRENGEAVR
jgi:phosphate transport system permease protein